MADGKGILSGLFDFVPEPAPSAKSQTFWAKMRLLEFESKFGGNAVGRMAGAIMKSDRMQLIPFCIKRDIDLSKPDWESTSLGIAARDHPELRPGYRKRGRPAKKEAGGVGLLSLGKPQPLDEELQRVWDLAEEIRVEFARRKSGKKPSDRQTAKYLVYLERPEGMKPDMAKTGHSNQFTSQADLVRQRWYQDKLRECRKRLSAIAAAESD